MYDFDQTAINKLKIRKPGSANFQLFVSALSFRADPTHITRIQIYCTILEINSLLTRMLKEEFWVYLSDYMKTDSRSCFYLAHIYNP